MLLSICCVKEYTRVGKSTFDLISNIMRYWFAGLIVLIVVRLFISVIKQSSKERSADKKKINQYQMGIVEIIDAGDNPKIYGQRFALRRENTLGRSSGCDIQINERSVRPVQAMIYQKGNQVFLRAMETHVGVFLNGEQVQGDIPLLDSDEIELSNVVLRLGLRGKSRPKQTNQEARTSLWQVLPQEEYEEDEYDEDEWDEDGEWDDEDEWDEDGEWDDEDEWDEDGEWDEYEEYEEDEWHEDQDEDAWIDEDDEDQDDDRPTRRRFRR